MPAPAAAVLGSTDESQQQHEQQPAAPPGEQSGMQRLAQQQAKQQQAEQQDSQQRAEQQAAAGAQAGAGAAGEPPAARVAAQARALRRVTERGPLAAAMRRQAQGRQRQPRPAQLADLVQEGQPDRLVPVLIHYTGSCRDVVALVRQFAQQGLSTRELTVACRRVGQLYTASLRVRGRGAKRQPLTPQALAWLDQGASRGAEVVVHCCAAHAMACCTACMRVPLCCSRGNGYSTAVRGPLHRRCIGLHCRC